MLHRAPGILDVLELVALKVLLGGEALATGFASEGPFARVGQHVALDVGRVVGRVTAQVARVLFLHSTARDGPQYGWVLLAATAIYTATPWHG